MLICERKCYITLLLLLLFTSVLSSVGDMTHKINLVCTVICIASQQRKWRTLNPTQNVTHHFKDLLIEKWLK